MIGQGYICICLKTFKTLLESAGPLDSKVFYCLYFTKKYIMAKDPAFLFYSQDWITGTQIMTFEDRGKYIHLLTIMHQQGRLSEETIRFLVGSISVTLRNKFKVDQETGLWYNEKLEKEIEKRAAFTESRYRNGSKGGRPPKKKTYHKPTENLPETYEKPSGFFNEANETTRLSVAEPTNNHTENENVIENKIEIEEEFVLKPPPEKKTKAKKQQVKHEIIYPFHSDEFMRMWENWKNYKREEHNFSYKSAITEQGALQDLCEKSEGHEINALKIIQKSIAGGWKGFFKLNENDKPKHTTRTTAERSAELNNALDEFFNKGREPDYNDHAA